MSNSISLLKARYCLSVMATAAHSSDLEARHLIDCLATEIPTKDASPKVAKAEADAHEALNDLADKMTGRSIAAVAGEWERAKAAVLAWMNAAD